MHHQDQASPELQHPASALTQQGYHAAIITLPPSPPPQHPARNLNDHPSGPSTELAAAIKDLTTTEELIATEQLTSLAAELSQRGHITCAPPLTIHRRTSPSATPESPTPSTSTPSVHDSAGSTPPGSAAPPLHPPHQPLTTVAWHATNVITMLTCYYQHLSPNTP